jgi:micrococcal nuclease
MKYDCVVTRVVDGDTVDAQIGLGFGVWIHRRVRLRGIDCPECRTSDPDEKVYGFLAKQALIDKLVETDFHVKVKCPPKNDKYGRVLGELWQSETVNVNQWLVDQYHAVKYHPSENKESLKDKHLFNRTKLEHGHDPFSG